MKPLCLISLIVCVVTSSSVFSYDLTKRSPCGAATSTAARAANQARYSWNNGAWWYRSVDGVWFVWTPGFWAQSRPQNNGNPEGTRTATDGGRVYSYKPATATNQQNPNVIVSYPDEDSENTYFGVDWYRNGRGPFSD